MSLRHKLHVCVAYEDGTETPAMSSAETTVHRRRLKNMLIGEKLNVLVIAPEESTYSVEIHEEKGGKNQ